jgi:citrate synthase
MAKTPEDLVDEAKAWWTTKIIDIAPGEIHVRGYAIQDLLRGVSFPQMIWLMLRGELPTPQEAALLEAALVASVDHGPHAPSIAIARMAVTCGLPLNGAMASAVNALDDIHGGAGQQCMEIYNDVRARIDGGEALEPAADAALDAYVAAHGKVIPGFGHRFHPVDPRSGPLLELAQAAADEGHVGGGYVAVGREVETALKRRTGKAIPMNIDGATAVIFSELGFAPELGRGVFVLSRSVGILAHAWEQTHQGGRIKGPMPKSIPFTYAGAARRALPQDAASPRSNDTKISKD